MRRLLQFFNARIRWLLGRYRRGRPDLIPRRLPPEALAQALKEAEFLKKSGVNVRYLLQGEQPGTPRVAEGEEPPKP